MDHESLASGLSLDHLVDLLTNNPPWWIYVILALIPLSVLYVARETCCWFWKTNRVLDSITRLERRLDALEARSAAPRDTSAKAGNDTREFRLGDRKGDDPYTLA